MNGSDLKSAARRTVIYITALSLLSCSCNIAPADTSTMSTRQLADRAKKADKIFEKRKAFRNRQLKRIMQNPSLSRTERMRAVRDLQDTFRKQSRRLYAKYRLPFLERILEETNAQLPEGKKIIRTKGTDVYLRDERGEIIRTDDGRPVLNPAHRGMDGGDLDLGGDPRAVKKLTEKLDEYDIQVTSDSMDAPGYKDYGDVEATVNIKGELDTPGSEAHLTQVQMDSFSKETYVSFAMAEDQPGRSLVEVNDDIKKGIEGFNTPPQKLLKVYDGNMQAAMQGMSKATLKSIDSGNVTDAQLKRILKESGLKTDVKKFKQQLKAIKKGHLAPEMGLDEKNIEAYQKACKKTTGQAVHNAETRAQTEIRTIRNDINELERLAASEDTPVSKRTEYREKADKLRKKVKDSEIRIEQSAAANREKLKGGNFDTYYEKQHVGSSSAKKTLPSSSLDSGKVSRMETVKGGLRPDLLSVAGYGLAAYNVYETVDKLEKGEISRSDAVISITKEVVDVGFGMATDVASFAAAGAIGAGTAGTIATIGVPFVVVASSSYALGRSVEEGLKTVRSYRNEELLQQMARSKTQENLNRMQIHVEELLKAGKATGDWRYFSEAEKIQQQLERKYRITGDTWYRDISDTVYERINMVKENLESEYGCSIYALKDRMEEEKKPAIGGIRITIGDFGDPELNGPAKSGDTVCFKARREGLWSDTYTVEWLINGKVYKEVSADTPGSGLFRFRIENAKTENYTVGLKIFEERSGELIGKDSVEFTVETDLPEELPGFRLKVTRDNYSAPTFEGYLSNGDILAAQADVPHPETEEPVATNLIWRIYRPDGEPIESSEKLVQAYESGGTKNYRYKIKLNGLSDGEHKLGLIHYLAENPDIRTQALFPFRIYNAVEFKELFVAKSAEDHEATSIIMNDQQPHIFMSYILKKGIDTVTIDCTLADKTTGDVLYDKSFELERKHKNGNETFGIKLAKGLVPVGHKASFTARIIPPDGKIKERHVEFSVKKYQIELSAPNTLTSGEKAAFGIQLPSEFVPPYKVDIDTGKGLMVHRSDGSLKGTVTGITGYGKAKERARLTISVTDREGRKGEALKSIVIIPRSPPVSPAENAYRPASVTGKTYNIVWVRNNDRGEGSLRINGSNVSGSVKMRDDMGGNRGWTALTVNIRGTYNSSTGSMKGSLSGIYTWWDGFTGKTTKGSCRGNFRGRRSGSGFRGTWAYRITVPSRNISEKFTGSWHTR